MEKEIENSDNAEWYFHVLGIISKKKDWRILNDRARRIVMNKRFDTLSPEERKEIFDAIEAKRDELKHQELTDILELLVSIWGRVLMTGSPQEVSKKIKAVITYIEGKDTDDRILKYYRLKGINLSQYTEEELIHIIKLLVLAFTYKKEMYE